MEATADALVALARELTQAALEGGPPLEFWRLMAARLSAAFGCERASIFQRAVKTGRLSSRFAEGLIGAIVVEPGDGVVGVAAQTLEPRLVNSPYSDPLFLRLVDARTGFRTENLLAFPLIFHGEAVGVIELVNKPRGFTQDDLSAVRRLGGYLSVLFVGMRLQEQQEELSRQLVQSEKMAALGRMAGGVAHEINNPLAAIMGFVDLLLRDPKTSPEAMASLLKVDAEARRMAKIVQNVLGLSRAPKPAHERLKLSVVMRDSIELLAHEVRRRGVHVVGPETAVAEPDVLGDSASLKQVFLNLMMNALQAMEAKPGGRLELSVRADGGRVFAEVKDDGPGVPLEVQDRLFEPFFTTKEAGKGTGLGLYVIKGIVENHGGSLGFENAAGGGAVFRASFPEAAAR